LFLNIKNHTSINKINKPTNPGIKLVQNLHTKILKLICSLLVKKSSEAIENNHSCEPNPPGKGIIPLAEKDAEDKPTT
jgi:hypothetical protein